MTTQKKLTVRLSDPVYSQLENVSRSTGQSLNSLLTTSALEWLKTVDTKMVDAPLSAGETSQDYDPAWGGVLEPYLRSKTIREINVLGTDCYLDGPSGKEYISLDISEIEFASQMTEFIKERTRRGKVSLTPYVRTKGVFESPDNRHYLFQFDVHAIPPTYYFREEETSPPHTFKDLVLSNAAPAQMGKLWEAIIKARFNVLICGEHGSGKTTWLRVFGASVDPHERVGVVERIPELNLRSLRHFPTAKDESGKKFLAPSDTITLCSLVDEENDHMDRHLRDKVRALLGLQPDRILLNHGAHEAAQALIEGMANGISGSALEIEGSNYGHALDRVLDSHALNRHDSLPNGFEAKPEGRMCLSQINIIIFLKWYPSVKREKRDSGRRVLKTIYYLETGPTPDKTGYWVPGPLLNYNTELETWENVATEQTLQCLHAELSRRGVSTDGIPWTKLHQ